MIKNLFKINKGINFCLLIIYMLPETLRMYPPLPFLDRMCTINPKESGYSLEPFNQFEIPNGMPVIIPIYAIQRDPKVFYYNISKFINIENIIY